MAEARALSGDTAEALKLAREAQRAFERNHNFQGSIWSRLLQSDCLRETSWRQATRLVKEARRRLEKRRLTSARARLYLEEAEIARARRRWKCVMQAIADFRNLLQNTTSFKKPPLLLLAHAALVEAECARQRRQPQATRLLKAARRAYSPIGARSFVARVDVALVLTGKNKKSHSRLLKLCRAAGYELEVARLENAKSGFYPIHFV